LLHFTDFQNFVCLHFISKPGVTSTVHSLVIAVVFIGRAHGDTKHCRKLFQRVLNSVSDWPECISEAYIQFEREEGNTQVHCVHYIEAPSVVCLLL